MADGLDSLTAMRNKTTTSRRAVPPPRHPPRQTPVQMPEPAPPTPPPAPSPRPVASGPAPMPVPGGSELAKASIYLDEHTDAYLETVRAAARTTKPRVDATRSAVVRLALNRLADQLTPGEVVAELQRNAEGHTGPGRKRS
ncbi:MULTISPECIES: hypothetical protein [Mycobacterium]|nr:MULTISPECIES: hypothetical protein [Mycobacterium]QLI58537.1 hypothetical protein KV38_26890 [Mycobacterium avium subsp. hominissuis]